MNLLPLAIVLLLSPNAVGKAAPQLTEHVDAIRKCRSPDLPGYVTVVDGEIVRDFRTTGRDTAAAKILPEASDILAIEVRCLRVKSTELESGWALRSAIIVLTKSGAPKVARAQLTELVEEQRLHLERTGRYAPSVYDLKFIDTRDDLGIDMQVNADGWSASVSFKELQLKCRVAVGGAAAADPELRPGVPACVSADGAVTRR
jgi:hypothetical protein